MAKKSRYMIVTPMKNEGPYILDWVAHHMALGFDHFFVVTNDCDDGTDRILDRLAEMGHVTHVPNPRMLKRSQGAWHVMTLRYAALFNIYRDADWIMFSDVDEYLQVNTRTKTLDGFLERVGPTDVISFTSIPYNSNGQKELVDAPLVGQFTQRNKAYEAAKQAGKPVMNAVKTIFRNDIHFHRRRNHRPLLPEFSQTNYVWRDGSGHVLDAEYTDGGAKAIDALSTVQFAQLNHYAIRSMEAFLVKVDRGDAVLTERLGASLNYWKGYNTPGDDDLRYATPSPAARKIRATFARDPELAEWHDFAVATHKAKVAHILDTEEGRSLAEQIGYFS
jgi:Domain of unknown function.